MRPPTMGEHLRAIATCDELLRSLDTYPGRPRAVRRLQRAIEIDQLAAALSLRELVAHKADLSDD